jgi:hypothetical protein
LNKIYRLKVLGVDGRIAPKWILKIWRDYVDWINIPQDKDE